MNQEHKKKPTANDVARLAGVSQPTVSRAFNPEYKMNEELRQRVYSAAAILQYRIPENRKYSFVQDEKTRGSKIIGITVAEIEDPFISEVLKKLVVAFQKVGYQPMLFTPEEYGGSKGYEQMVSRARSYHINVMILLLTYHVDVVARECVKQGMSTILFNRYLPGSNTSAVICNDFFCSETIAKAFLKMGYTKFAFLSSSTDASTVQNRQNGFLTGLQSAGKDALIVDAAGYTYDDGFAAAKEMLRLQPDTDACFCSCDLMALGALDYLQDVAKKRIPEDIGVVGFDDIPMSQNYHYQLSTVRQPWTQLIEAMVSTVIERIDTPTMTPFSKMIDGEIIYRKTTRALPAID